MHTHLHIIIIHHMLPQNVRSQESNSPVAATLMVQCNVSLYKHPCFMKERTEINRGIIMGLKE